MKLPKLLILFSILTVTLPLWAGTSEQDSLLHLLRVSPETEQAHIYNELSYLLSGTDALGSLVYGKNALLKSEKNHQPIEKFNALQNIAYAYEQADSLERAIDYYQQSVKTARSMEDTMLMARSQFNLGTVYTNQGYYENALEHLIKSLNYLELYNNNHPSVNNDKHLSFIANNIGIVFNRMGDSKKAMEYYQYSLKTRRNLRDSLGIANMLNNIGLLYAKRNRLDTAKACYDEAISIEQRFGDSASLAETVLNYWEIMIRKRNYARAAAFFDTVKTFLPFLKTGSTIVAMNNIALVWLSLDQPVKAYPYILSAINLANKNKVIAHLSDSYMRLSDYYAKKLNFAKAYEYQKKYIKIKDSVMNAEVATKLAQMQARYETQKKEKRIAILEKDKQVTRAEADKQRTMKLIYLATSLVILLLAGFVILEIRNRAKQKQHHLEKRNLENEQKLLRAQMNPHFIFNSLNTVQGYISANNSFVAMRFLSKFGQLLRDILENSRKSLISLENELKTLELYIDMERQRANNAFDYTLEVDNAIDPGNVAIPPLIIQPFVENAIKHGLKTKSGKGSLKVMIKKRTNHLEIEIIDNGIGRQKAAKLSKASAKHHQSLGMKLTADRLKNTGKALGGSASYRVIDIISDEGEPKGTRVLLTIPIAEFDIL